MSTPAVGPAATRTYELLDPLTREDTEPNWPLLALVAGITAGDELPWLILEEPGLRAYLSVDAAPPAWLPLLAAIDGGRLTKGMTVAQQREEVRLPSGRRRGLPGTIIETAQRFMQDPKRVRLRERTHPSTPGDQSDDLIVQVRASDVTPGEEDRLEAAVLAALPIGLIGHVVFTDLVTYDDVLDDHTDYADVDASHADYDDLLTP